MPLDKGNKYEIRHRALLEAVRICGGVTAYSKRINVSRSRASNWVNQAEIEIPYEFVILTEDATQVSIERLSPYTEAANKIIRRLRTKDKHSLISLELNSILIGEQHYIECVSTERPIIIGTDRVLINGLAQIEAKRLLGLRRVQVTILDLEALVLEKRSLKETSVDLLISEKIAIGLRLEQLLGNHQGKRNDIAKSQQTIKKNIDGNPLCPIWDKVGRVDSYISYLVGLSSKNTYHRAKQVCLQGNLELIRAMDSEKISIAMAAQKVKAF
jgi:hypothetical protein